MIEVTTRFDMTDANRGFLGLSKQSERRALAYFQELKPIAKDDLKKHQKERSGGTGKWPALAPSTRRRRILGQKGKRRKRGSRRMLGRLPTAFKSYTSPDHLKLVHMVRWGLVHNIGGTAGRGANIPKRQFIWWSKDFIDDAMKAWHDFVLMGWEKG